MLGRAISALKSNEDKALAEFNDPDNKQFHDHDLYVVCFNMSDGKITASSGPALLGVDIRTLSLNDDPTGQRTYDAIHEARKRVKKVRAILELIDDDGGSGLAHSEKRLRIVNRTLSTLRDADAMLSILTKLRSRNPRLFSEHTFALVRRRLLAHKRQAMKSAERSAATTTLTVWIMKPIGSIGL